MEAILSINTSSDHSTHYLISFSMVYSLYIGRLYCQ